MKKPQIDGFQKAIGLLLRLFYIGSSVGVRRTMNSNMKATLIGSGVLHKQSATYGLTKHRCVQRTICTTGRNVNNSAFVERPHPVPDKAPGLRD
jgi:hypothetical protein